LNFNLSKKHYADLLNNYQGKIVIINLIDQHKEGTDQKKIGELFVKSVKEANFPKIEISWFDFHEECKKMKYENIAKLLKRNSVSNGVNSFGYTHVVLKKSFTFERLENSPKDAAKDFQIQSLQDGVFRTNCIDCLDRTNVIQTVLARQALHKIFHKIGLEEAPTGEVFENFLYDFEAKYKELWADNGDLLSIAYAGTNAMKGDFTRYGKKSLKGTIIDGKLTMTRYFINAFKDGYNQDCHDLFLGKVFYIIFRKNKSKLKLENSLNNKCNGSLLFKSPCNLHYLLFCYVNKFSRKV